MRALLSVLRTLASLAPVSRAMSAVAIPSMWRSRNTICCAAGSRPTTAITCSSTSSDGVGHCHAPLFLRQRNGHRSPSSDAVHTQVPDNGARQGSHRTAQFSAHHPQLRQGLLCRVLSPAVAAQHACGCRHKHRAQQSSLVFKFFRCHSVSWLCFFLCG